MELQKNPLFGYILLPLAAAGLNTGLNFINRILDLPFFFDSIGTAAVAALAGIVPGLIAGVLSQLGMELAIFFGDQTPFGTAFPFVLCQFATAGVVGLMVRKKLFSSPLNLAAAILGVTMGNAVIGSFVATFLFGGITLHGSDFLMAGFIIGGQSLLEAAFWSRIPLNLIDKGLAVSVAFALYSLQTQGKLQLSRSR